MTNFQKFKKCFEPNLKKAHTPSKGHKGKPKENPKTVNVLCVALGHWVLHCRKLANASHQYSENILESARNQLTKIRCFSELFAWLLLVLLDFDWIWEK